MSPRGKMCLSALIVLGLACLQTSAQPINPDQMHFETPPDGFSNFNFGVQPIPPGFFGPGSDPFEGTICLTHGPFVFPSSTTGTLVDTVISRNNGVNLDPPPQSGVVDIQITELSLTSCQPITVTYDGGNGPELWDVFLSLDDVNGPSVGQMQIDKINPNGGIFTGQIQIKPLFIFRRVSDEDQSDPPLILDSTHFGPIMIQILDPVPWTTAPDPLSTDGLIGFGGNLYPDPLVPVQWVDPVGGALTLTQNPATFVDCDGDNIADELEITLNPTLDTNFNNRLDSCEFADDDDGDGVPNATDNLRFVYNPDQNPTDAAGCQMEQITYEDQVGGNIEPDTDFGFLTMNFPSAGVPLFVNVIYDGRWAVRNLLLQDPESATGGPVFETGCFIDIGDRGIPQTGDIRDYTILVTTDPFRFDPRDTYSNLASFIQQLTVGARDLLIGLMETIDALRLDLPAAEEYRTRVPAPGTTKMSKVRPGYEQVDLDSAGESNSCAPGAVSSSLNWLNTIYGLPGADTLAMILDDLREAMDTLDGRGPSSWDIIPAAKRGYANNKCLPYTVQTEGTPFMNGMGMAPSMQNMFDAFCKGADVEAYYLWYYRDAMGNWVTGTHAVSVVGMHKCVGPDGTVTWSIQIAHDLDQDSAGGLAGSPYTVTVDTLPDGRIRWRGCPGNAIFLGWTAETPTTAQILCAFVDTLLDIDSRLPGPIDAANAEGLCREANLAKFQAQAIQNSVATGNGPDAAGTAAEQNLAQQLLDKACEIKDKAQEIKDLVGDPGQAGAINDLGALLADADNLWFMLKNSGTYDLPNDADKDGVADADDNAPNKANPGQEDENNNGTADILELDSNTDKNGNGILDEVEIAQGLDCDCNMNGIPDRKDIDDCVLRDLNQDRIPDICPGKDQCPGDVNGDGVTAVGDILDFLALWAAGDKRGDWNLDGTNAVGDILDFLAAWAAGC